MRPGAWRLLLVRSSGLILANILRSSDWKSLACNLELLLDGNSRLVMKCFLVSVENCEIRFLVHYADKEYLFHRRC